jgi:hypothetical protein
MRVSKLVFHSKARTEDITVEVSMTTKGDRIFSGDVVRLIANEVVFLFQ